MAYLKILREVLPANAIALPAETRRIALRHRAQVKGFFTDRTETR